MPLHVCVTSVVLCVNVLISRQYFCDCHMSVKGNLLTSSLKLCIHADSLFDRHTGNKWLRVSINQVQER